MKLDELIKDLQAIREREGNLDMASYRFDSGEEWLTYQFPFPVVIPVTEEESYGVTIVTDVTGEEALRWAGKRVVKM